MSARIFSKIAIAAVVLLCASAANAGAQAYSGYSPYSIYGVGDFPLPGTAYNRSMGGVGIASRNNRFLNPLNPAAVTARDTLAFMADFSVYGDNKIFSQGSAQTANNVFNMGDIIFSFPIYKSSAMMVGIMPYSTTGYSYSFEYNDPSVLGKTGTVQYTAYGQGAIYQLFAAAGVTFFKRISLGAQATYYFGNTSKEFYETFGDSSFNGAKNGYNIESKAVAGKFGIQYEQPLGSKSSIIVGATYTMGSKLKGVIEGYKYSTGTAATDTLYHKMDTLSLPSSKARLASEIGIGICFKYADKLQAEFDWTRSDWSACGLDSTPGLMGNTASTATSSAFSASVSQAFRVGFEYVPNRNDIRYFYKKIAYRAGAYYKTDYYKLDGNTITAMGITVGATIPVFRWYNGLTVGIDFGQRGALNDNLIQEKYINFSVGMNIFDIWFQKPRYE